MKTERIKIAENEKAEIDGPERFRSSSGRRRRGSWGPSAVADQVLRMYLRPGNKGAALEIRSRN